MTQTPDEVPSNGKETIIACEASLDIANAASLKTTLLNALSARQSVVVDGAAVEKADTAALQLLSAFFKDASAQGVAVRWTSPSPALCTAAGLLGLKETLALAEAVNE
jgi:anti-anti-sigma regulatory factor